jgi:hypothetical protein
MIVPRLPLMRLLQTRALVLLLRESVLPPLMVVMLLLLVPVLVLLVLALVPELLPVPVLLALALVPVLVLVLAVGVAKSTSWKRVATVDSPRTCTTLSRRSSAFRTLLRRTPFHCLCPPRWYVLRRLVRSDSFPAHLLYSRSVDVGRIITLVSDSIDKLVMYDEADPDTRSQEGKRKLKVPQ